MAKKTVEQELQEATGVKPKAKEKPQDYLKRLHSAASELDDDGWKALGTPAQKWVNEATKAFDADKDIPGFDDGEEAAPAAPKKGAKAKAPADEEEGEAAEEESAVETETEGEEAEPAEAEDNEDTNVKRNKPAPKKGATKPAPKAEKAPAKKAAPPAKKVKSSGGVQAVLAHVLKSPDDSPADIVKALKADGITVTISTVSSARGFFKLVTRFLQSKKLTTKIIFKD